MKTLFLDRFNNWLWHQWSPSYSEQSLCSRITQIISYPLMTLGSITCGTLVALRNRVFSKPVFNDAELKLQFSSLTTRPSFVSTKAAGRHPTRNRWSDVKPFDHNRVRLQDSKFYFNASRTLGGKAIATQGPLPNEFDEFWKMVWEEKCSLLVMLTNFREKGINKCACYWASDTKNFSISQTAEETLFQEDSGAKIVQRIFDVTKGEESKTFTQLHLVDWPDHGVVAPKLLEQLVRFSHKEKKGSGPMLAHCSAGIGRTGTFLAAYQAFQTGSKRVFPIADSLRHERMWMIQRPEQYILAQRAIELLT